MTPNEIRELWNALGGIKGLIRFAKKDHRNLSQVYSMFGQKSVEGAGDVQHAAPFDPIAAQAAIESAFMKAIAGQRRQKELGVDARGYPVVDDASGDRAISDTSHGITATSKPTPDSTPSKPDDRITKAVSPDTRAVDQYGNGARS
jgi:hypothetical protein